MAQHWVIRPVQQHLRCQAGLAETSKSTEHNTAARTGSAQSTVALSIRQREEQKVQSACIPTFRQPASVDMHTQTGAQMYAFPPLSLPPLHTLTHSCRRASRQSANGNGRKEASGRPVEISHLIALHLQVANVVFRQEQGLLSKPGVARIHKAACVHSHTHTHIALTQSTSATGAWALLPPVIFCCRGLS